MEPRRRVSSRGCLRIVQRVALIVVVLAASANAGAQGGPPLIVDDPDTPGPGYWEINVASVVENSQSERRREAPLVDINYGVGRRIQLKVEVPWLTVQPTGGVVGTGLGNTTVGVKWRFLGEEGRRIAWATYPQLEIVSGRAMAKKGLLDDGMRFLLPTELTLEMGHFEINTEVGRTFAEKSAGAWTWGISTEVGLRRFELVGEVHGERTDGSATEIIVEGGLRAKVTRQVRLLAAAGPSVHGLPEERLRLRVYFGVQFNLPRPFQFEPLTDGR